MKPFHHYAVDQLSATERIAEIGRILARGLLRLRSRQSSRESAQAGESLLDFTPDQSGVGNTTFGDQHRER